MEDNKNNEKNRAGKKALKICLISGGILIIMAVIAFIIIMNCLLSDTTYHYFTEKRKAEMELRFGISVTDDVRLIEYIDKSFLIAIDQSLEIEVDDSEKFLRENINFEMEETDDRWSGKSQTADGGKCRYFMRVPFNANEKITVYPPDGEGKSRIKFWYWD